MIDGTIQRYDNNEYQWCDLTTQTNKQKETENAILISCDSEHLMVQPSRAELVEAS